MMHSTLPDYQTLQESLQRLDTEITPSEIHGTISGVLCAHPSVPPQTWQDHLWPHWDKNDPLANEILAALNELHDITLQQLNDPACDFQLLLPDDDDSLDARVHALGDWCQGFLSGLALGGIKDFIDLPDDGREVAEDLVEIARAGSSYHLEGSEEDEQAYAELMEYMRVGVLLLNEELQPIRSEPEPTHH